VTAGARRSRCKGAATVGDTFSQDPEHYPQGIDGFAEFIEHEQEYMQYFCQHLPVNDGLLSSLPL
jgi:hypothetical protein